jgi:hypothetical protein
MFFPKREDAIEPEKQPHHPKRRHQPHKKPTNLTFLSRGQLAPQLLKKYIVT